MDYLFNQLKKLVNFDDGELTPIARHLKKERLAKRDFLFQENETYNRIGFIAKGLVKKIYLTHEGKEFIKEFASEGEIIAPYSSLLQSKRTIFSIQAIEDTDLVTIDWQQVVPMFSTSIHWMELGKRIAEVHFINREVREFELLKMSAIERYKAFEKRYSHLQGRLKKQDIAAYLGITPVALSRIITGYVDYKPKSEI